MEHYVGLDVSLKLTAICIVDRTGKIEREGVVASDPETITAFIKSHAPHVTRIGLETGATSTWLWTELNKIGLPIICIDARHAKAALKMQINKSDRNDAVGIARIMQCGWYKEVRVKDLDSHAIKALLVSRALLVKIKRDLENQIRGLLKNLGLVIGRAKMNVFAVRAAELAEARPQLAAAVEPLLKAREAVGRQIADLDRKVMRLARNDARVRRFMTAPGVGPITALCFLATIDDPTRFKRSRSVGAYVGLTTRRYASGEIDWTGRISKCGDAMLRSYLYEAANVLLTRVAKWSTLKAWGIRLAKRSGLRKAKVAVARKLAVILHRMWIKAPNSNGHQRRPLNSLHSRTTEFPPTRGKRTSLPGRWRWCDRPRLCDARKSCHSVFLWREPIRSKLGEDAMAMPVTRYAKSGDVHIAYQVFGNGPIDLVFVPGFVSHIENYWEHPDLAGWLLRLAKFARVVMFDKRGTGLSDRVAELPSFDLRMDDARAVMDAAGIDRAALFGISEGGPMAALFAATYPERCRGLVLYGSFASASSWLTPDGLAGNLGYIHQAWGSGANLPVFAPSRQNDPALQQFWGRFERLGASPAAAIAVVQLLSEIDISEILPSIHVPTLVIHCTEDTLINVGCGRFLAEHIPGARLVELPGEDHFFFLHDKIVDAIEEFLTGSISATESDRILATVLFTDIVGSTARAEQLGDQRWHNLLGAHHTTVRRELAVARQGSEIAWGWVSRYLRRPGACRALRLRHCGGGSPARHSSPQWPSYRRDRNRRQRRPGHRRPYRLARLGACRAWRGAGIANGQGSGCWVGSPLQ
jgi:transposase